MIIPRQRHRPYPEPASSRYVWYAAFGSNMHLIRLNYYLSGGRPPGGRRTYPGCRDKRRPVRTAPVMLPGDFYFALESPVWTGGLAFYDPRGDGRTAARAYLVTREQFSDIAAQEMYREPGVNLDLSEVLASGRAEMGTGRYETLVCPGFLDGHPVLTFTAPWGMHDVPWSPPAANYLRYLASGLAQSHAWPPERIAGYLATSPGSAGHWTPGAVAALMAERPSGVRQP